MGGGRADWTFGFIKSLSVNCDRMRRSRRCVISREVKFSRVWGSLTRASESRPGCLRARNEGTLDNEFSIRVIFLLLFADENSSPGSAASVKVETAKVGTPWKLAFAWEWFALWNCKVWQLRNAIPSYWFHEISAGSFQVAFCLRSFFPLYLIFLEVLYQFSSRNFKLQNFTESEGDDIGSLSSSVSIFFIDFSLSLAIPFFFLCSEMRVRKLKNLTPRVINRPEIFVSRRVPITPCNSVFYNRDYVPRLRTGVFEIPSFYLSFMREPISTR